MMSTSENRAAIIIQRSWHVYKVRKLRENAEIERRKAKAAVIIQRAVRHMLSKMWQSSFMSTWNEIPYNLQRQINQNISMWKMKTRDLSTSDQVGNLEREVQRLYHLWQLRAPERENLSKSLESQYTRTEATSLILEGSKSLADFQPSDTGFYWCSSVAIAVQARLKVKEMLLSIEKSQNEGKTAT